MLQMQQERHHQQTLIMLLVYFRETKTLEIIIKRKASTHSKTKHGLAQTFQYEMAYE